MNIDWKKGRGGWQRYWWNRCHAWAQSRKWLHTIGMMLGVISTAASLVKRQKPSAPG